MCDICKSAASELKIFLAELQKKYPGTTLEGGVPVTPGHHVFVALLEAGDPYYQEERAFIEKVIAEEVAKQGPLSGGSPFLVGQEIQGV